MIKKLITRNGTIPLPAFFPDATHAGIRAGSFDDVETSGLYGVEMNTYHLMSRLGGKLIKSLGGLRGFSSYKGVILTDSGGFQLYSLIKENPAYGEIRDNEIIFRPGMGPDKLTYTPEKCMTAQMQFSSDIMMALDLCTSPDDPYEAQKRAVDLTVKWGERCKAEFEKLTARMENKPLLFGIVQGGQFSELRRGCGRRLEDTGFDGYGFGGFPIDENGELRLDILKMAADAMPDDKLKYAMGLGKPEEIVECVKLGYELFDCVIPTREARHQRLYVFTKDDALYERFYTHMYIADEKYIRDGRPVDETCDCALCRRYSRAYLHHLYMVNDPAAYRLATAHNLRFYGRLMERIAKDGI